LCPVHKCLCTMLQDGKTGLPAAAPTVLYTAQERESNQWSTALKGFALGSVVLTMCAYFVDGYATAHPLVSALCQLLPHVLP
jgi:hypothetical protein